jgi:1,5-anhydro-D-fructose reductase (1,5-anhydro-D-mannitol-forming)
MVNGWGLIGTGKIADDRILPGINAVKGNKLVAVVSRDPARAKAYAEKFGAEHAYTSYEEMLRNPDVTVVAIHTPNSLHPEQTIAAARAGKHVFCDKPIAIKSSDAEVMVAECKKAGVKFGVNFHNRFLPGFNEAKRIVASGEIGQPILIELEASPGARPGGTLASWRVDPEMTGLGTTMSIGVHLYDIIRHILDSEIVEVSAIFDKPKGVMEEMALATLRFDNGTLAQLAIYENAPNPHNNFIIYGSKGRITGKGLTRSRFAGEMEILTDSGTRVQKFDVVNAHAGSVAAFSNALLEGREPSPSGFDGLQSVRLTEAMARSAYEGRHIKL